MKNLKPSKLLIFTLGIATLITAFGAPNVKAEAQVQYNRSVRDMMARRHNASVKPSRFSLFGTNQKPADTKVSQKNIVGARPAYTPPKTSRIITRAEYDASIAPKPEPAVVYAQPYTYAQPYAYEQPYEQSPHSFSFFTASNQKSSSSLFDTPKEEPWYPPADKDGSLFPGGPCRNCHKTGPLIDTGPCDRCYDNGPLIDTGPCDRCYDDGALFNTPCDRCYDDGALIDTPCDRCYDDGALIDTPCEACEEPAPEIIMQPECDLCAQPIIEETEPQPLCDVCADPAIVPAPVPVPAPIPACAAQKPASPHDAPIVQAMDKNCCSMAPIWLDYVDFNLSQNEDTGIKNHVGNYRFRIFGCRRYEKNAILNSGRIMEKDMRFANIFKETVGDCYNIVKMPEDICLQKTPTPLPEYILSAEITNLFMNVCDKHDWESAKAADARTGSSEITVRWKLSNPSKTKIVWEGETSGYADLKIGLEDGEIALIEAAFADAVSNLQALPGFEDQLMVRLSPEELTSERNALIDEEHALNPAKCKFAEPLYQAKQCEITRPEANITKCPAFQAQFVPPAPKPCPKAEPCPVAQPTPVIQEDAGLKTENLFLESCIDENGGIKSGGSCTVVDDTWVDTDLKTFDSLCITTRAPYDVLTPENLYKVRASVVEISNVAGKKGAGLIISDSFVITSADLVDNQYNTYKIRTINGKDLSGHAVRVNPSKNTALIMLDTKTEYTPLPLNTDLPKTGQSGFMTLGLLDVDVFDNGSENYIDNSGKITGFRYSDEKGAEIIVDTNVQTIAIGSVLIDAHGSVNGFAHTGQKTDNGNDLFLPTETALRSLGLTICDCAWEAPSKFQQTVYKPVTELVHTVQKAPEEMKKTERK